MNNLIPPLIHNATDIPTVLLANHPPQIAPIRKVVMAPNLRFLFTFSLTPVKSFWSVMKSQYTLVSTVVGISPKPKRREAAI